MAGALAIKQQAIRGFPPCHLEVAQPSEPSPPPPTEKTPRPDRRGFVTTRWTLVSLAGNGQGDDRVAALEHLCEAYRPAILAYLQRTGNGPEDAEDLTQQFFYQLLTENTLARAQASRGKFRSFLLTCVSNFARDQHQRAQALKRGGGVQFELIEESDPPSAGQSPDQAFDRKWAETIISQALSRLENEARNEGKPFEQLKCYLVDSKGEVPFEEKAAELGISTSALKSAVYRLRQRYVASVKELVAETISPDDSIEEELQCLLAILSD